DEDEEPTTESWRSVLEPSFGYWKLVWMMSGRREEIPRLPAVSRNDGGVLGAQWLGMTGPEIGLRTDLKTASVSWRSHL
ncbi:MAG: hypothetical protein PVH80_09275, partial [Anaerolineae bacterium]